MPHKGFQRGRPLQLKVQDAEAIQKQVPEIEHGDNTLADTRRFFHTAI